MTVKPGEFDLTIYQGALFNEQFQFFLANGTTPMNLTGFTARLQMRSTYGAPDAYVTLTTENGGITIEDAAQGLVTIKIDATETALLTQIDGVYDLKMLPDGDEERAVRVMWGTVRLSREVTE